MQHSSGHGDSTIGFILCMSSEEAGFFRPLVAAGTSRWTRQVATLDALLDAVGHVCGPTRLISFCSDLIIPPGIIKTLGGNCFNFHSGPPERRGYRPAAFAARDHASEYGVTFHRLTATIDAGPIYATKRFPINHPVTEEALSERAYVALLSLARTVAPLLSDFDSSFVPSGDAWTGGLTTKADYRRLRNT